VAETEIPFGIRDFKKGPDERTVLATFVYGVGGVSKDQQVIFPPNNKGPYPLYCLREREFNQSDIADWCADREWNVQEFLLDMIGKIAYSPGYVPKGWDE
jgi:hypothetical protein